MKVSDTELAGLKIIEPAVFHDVRGSFMESWNHKTFCQNVQDADFVQDNHSVSKRNVLRGLHYQIKHPQGKLVRVVTGEVYDVAVDIRKSSATFLQWVGVYLSAENRKVFWVPPGFAHGFLVLSDIAEFVYKCSDYYCPDQERTILWNDETLGIEWPVTGDCEPVLSEKDLAGDRIRDAEFFE